MPKTNGAETTNRLLWTSSVFLGVVGICVGDFASSSLMTELMPGKYVLSKAAKEPSAPHRRMPFPGDGGNLLVYVELGQVGAQDLYSISLFLRGEPALISR